MRADVYALVEVLRERRIAHGLAHPLESPNRKLDAKTLEKLTLLFSTFEVVNGRTEERLNAGIRALLRDLDALRAQAAQPAAQPAAGARSRSATGDQRRLRRPRASARRQLLHRGRRGRSGVEEFLQAVMAGQARASGRGADVVGLGLGFGSTTYRYLETLASEGTPLESPFADLMDAHRRAVRAVQRRARRDGRSSSSTSSASSARSAPPIRGRTCGRSRSAPRPTRSRAPRFGSATRSSAAVRRRPCRRSWRRTSFVCSPPFVTSRAA